MDHQCKWPLHVCMYSHKGRASGHGPDETVNGVFQTWIRVSVRSCTGCGGIRLVFDAGTQEHSGLRNVRASQWHQCFCHGKNAYTIWSHEATNEEGPWVKCLPVRCDCRYSRHSWCDRPRTHLGESAIHCQTDVVGVTAPASPDYLTHSLF